MLDSPGVTPPPAGWYPDPTTPRQQRYWDGAAWSAETRPEPDTTMHDELAAPENVAAAVASASAYAEAVSVGSAPTGSLTRPTVTQTMIQARAPYVPSPTRRAASLALFVVGGLVLAVSLLALAGAIPAPGGLVPSLALLGIVIVLAGVVVRLGWPRR